MAQQVAEDRYFSRRQRWMQRADSPGGRCPFLACRHLTRVRLACKPGWRANARRRQVHLMVADTDPGLSDPSYKTNEIIVTCPKPPLESSISVWPDGRTCGRPPHPRYA